MMKRLLTVFVVVMSVVAVAHGQQSAEQLIQSGLYKEQVKGDLDGAIAEYQRVVKEFSGDRGSAANALLRIGLCYEKLGVTEAQKSYQRIIKDYADQAEPVRIARQHLQQLEARAPGSGPTYRLVLDSEIAGMPVYNRGWSRRLDFSPSGDRIVFESQGKLYVADETGTLIQPILNNPAPWEHFAWLRWSPDGRQIAYVASRPGKQDSLAITENAVFVLNLESGTSRKIMPVRRGHLPYAWLDWTHNGKQLTYLDGDGIHVVALDGSEVSSISSKVLPGKAHPRYASVELSPDGQWFVYSGFREDASQKHATAIWILPAGGGQAQALRHRQGNHKYPTWSPDGRSLIFVSGTVDTGNIWKVAIDPETGVQDGESEQITFFDDTRIGFPKILGDGSRIAFEMEKANTSIYVANASPPYGPRAVVRSSDHMPQVSPDGQTIYYVNDGIFAVSRAGGTPRRLTERPPLRTHKFMTNFHLSSDGRTLAYIGKLSEGRGLFTLPVEGGEPRLLTKTFGMGVVPQWSPDGTQLAYTEGNDIHVIPAAGGEPVKIAHLKDSGRKWTGWDAWTLRWSPDGEFLAAIGYTKEQNGIFVVPAAGGELRQITPDGPDSSYLEGVEWHPDGQRLSYNVDRRESEARIAYLDGRPPTLLVDHPDGWDYIGAWAPDGRRFFYMCEVELEVAWGIFAYDEVSHETTRFADNAAELSPPSWSRDGKTAAWWVTRKTQNQAWVMESYLSQSTDEE